MAGGAPATPDGGEEFIPRRAFATRAAALLGGLFVSSALTPVVAIAGKKRKKNKGKSKKKNKGNKSKSKSRKKKKQKQKGSANGQAIVRFAQKYKGTRYVWGGESPRGFDCSGFTWYVYNHAAGIEIGRTEDEQWKKGRSVSRGSLQPGDLVFFKNTFERGLSHVGIYMRGSNFIHAENENTGVVVSSLNSDYYSQHYAGARRIV